MDEVINYVMDTPGNTNPNVLRGMLEKSGDGDRFVVTYSTDNMTTWTCDKTFAQITAAMAAGKQIVIIGSVGGVPIYQECSLEYDPINDYVVILVQTSIATLVRIIHDSSNDISVSSEELTAPVPRDQGVSHAGEFLVVGSDGYVTTKQQNEGVTVSAAGAVTQALDAGKLYHFTGALTALTITLNSAASGQLAQYHFDFNCGSTAPTVTIPNTVTMPDGNSFDANKHYEVDILNNYGAVMAWPIS